MLDALLSRLTPVVGRLLAINAVVLLLQQTILTSSAITDALRFDPSSAFRQPWTFVTYMFVHGGLLHLLGNSLALLAFGPTVERRMGGASFALFYLYCGVGAAAFALLIHGALPVTPFVGASGAVLGVALAFARQHPDAEMLIFPFPAPIKARTLIAVIAAFDVLGLFIGGGAIAHEAHLGGMALGWLWFAAQRVSRGRPAMPMPPMRPRVSVPVAHGIDRRGEQAAPSARADVAPSAADLARAEQAELDRLLDKIGATGLDSLTDGERTFLDQVSKRRKSGA
jgi:membrane associated rhomboid family serine protease